MKTNIVMKSEQDRNLFGIVIRQETKTGFLNLSDLQEAYDRVRFIEGWSERRIEHITITNEFKERCFYILEKTRITSTTRKSVFYKNKIYGFYGKGGK